MKHKARRTQPRIAGIRRIPKIGSLLPAVQQGLESIARLEKRSVSWVIAEIVSDYFGYDCLTNHKTKAHVIKFRKRA